MFAIQIRNVVTQLVRTTVETSSRVDQVMNSTKLQGDAMVTF